MTSGQVYMSDPQKLMAQKYQGQGQQLTDDQHQMMLGTGLNMNLASAGQPAVDIHGNVTLTGLALGHGPPQSVMPSMAYPVISSSSMQPGSVNIAGGDWNRYKDRSRQESFRGNQVDEMMFEDDIRAKRLEMDNEDLHMQIQQLLRVFISGQGDQTPLNYGPLQGDENYSFSGFPPNTPDSLMIDKPGPNGEANVGRLKLKAAFSLKLGQLGLGQPSVKGNLPA